MSARDDVPALSVDDVRVLLTQGRAWINGVADLEGWPDEERADRLTRIACTSVASLPAEVEHFRARLAEARARATPRGVVTGLQSCPGCGFKRDRRGFVIGTLGCVGTSKSCRRDW